MTSPMYQSGGERNRDSDLVVTVKRPSGNFWERHGMEPLTPLFASGVIVAALAKGIFWLGGINPLGNGAAASAESPAPEPARQVDGTSLVYGFQKGKEDKNPVYAASVELDCIADNKEPSQTVVEATVTMLLLEPTQTLARTPERHAAIMSRLLPVIDTYTDCSEAANFETRREVIGAFVTDVVQTAELTVVTDAEYHRILADLTDLSEQVVAHNFSYTP